VPGAPQVFDTILLATTGLFRPVCFRAISKIEAEVRNWPGMETRAHRFGGIGFFPGGKECGHIHGNGLLDCWVGSVNRDVLVGDGRALPHHIFPRSGWISFWVEDEGDVASATELIRMAAGRGGTG
jgi:hypothetical protein